MPGAGASGSGTVSGSGFAASTDMYELKQFFREEDSEDEKLAQQAFLEEQLRKYLPMYFRMKGESEEETPSGWSKPQKPLPTGAK